jgi:Serine carboxypeptidase S28
MFLLFFLSAFLVPFGLCVGAIHAMVPLPVPIEPNTTENGSLPPTLTIDIPIDHFNDSDTRTYKNRYWINDRYYQEGGPVIFFDVGESGANEENINRTLGENGTLRAPLRLAQRFNGMAVLWEHRFYGESLPFPVDNDTGMALGGYDAYKYLNNEQALQDTVYFAENFGPPGYEHSISLSPSQTPWIWVGGSYPGARGAMMRIRNPDIFYATWASSAPVEAQVDMSVYFNPIQQTMPANCSADAAAAIAYADDISLNGTPDDVATLRRAIFLASGADSYSKVPRVDPANAGDFSYYQMGTNLSYVFSLSNFAFQSFNYDGSLANFCDYLESWNPENATRFDINTTGTAWLENSADLKFTTDGIAASFGTKQAFYAFLSASVYKYQQDKQVDYPSTSPVDSMSWNWQYCSEFGYFQSANVSDPTSLISRFVNVTSFGQNQCKNIFSFVPNSPKVDRILKYGGYNMTPSNTMFTDGERDPWRTLGVQANKKINPSAVVRESTTNIPRCNGMPEGNKVFGKIYPGEVHASDLGSLSEAGKSDSTNAADVGLNLFSKALEQWLACFGQ